MMMSSNRWLLWCGCFLVILSPCWLQMAAAQDEDRPLYKSKYRVLTTVRNEARALYYKSQRLVGRLSGVEARAAAAG